MFEHIDETLKKLSIVIFILGILVSIIWFIRSVGVYFDNKDFIYSASVYGGGYSSSSTELGNLAYSGKVGMKFSVYLLILSILSSFLIYGFADIIYYLKDISSKMNNSEKDKEVVKNINVSNSKADLLASTRSENSVDWECKKCGEVNTNSNLFCKSCGVYR